MAQPASASPSLAPPRDPGTRAAPRVLVVGGGVAGLSTACALAAAGLRVHLVEKRNHLGGRATSFRHPGVQEVMDNCQHVIFGCCTNIQGFYERIGVAGRIHWTDAMTMIEPGGRVSRLGASGWPAPLHGLPGLLRARAFSWADKLALARAFLALRAGVPPDSRETLGAWLARHGQTPGAIERFWRLVIASALNADLDTIALPYAAKVIRELFLASAAAGRMGMARVPLAELHASARGLLERAGAVLAANTRVESAAWSAAAGQWTVQTSAGPLTAEYLVLALPFESLAKLLPGLPPAPGAAALAAQLQQHVHWPICSVHLWFEQEITPLEHAVLLDREIHWMYNKSRLQPARPGPGSYLELVISASRRFAALPQEAAIRQAVAELGEFFPAARTTRLVKAALIKEVHATFGVPPGIDAARPGALSPWPRCFLAGDWVATGWPSTMESAARSGHLAAEAVCREAGQPRRFLVPDLDS